MPDKPNQSDGSDASRGNPQGQAYSKLLLGSVQRNDYENHGKKAEQQPRMLKDMVHGSQNPLPATAS